MVNDVQKHFDQLAPTWSDNMRIYGYRERFEAVKRMVKGLEGGRVLDIGCGTGDYSVLFPYTGYLGIDVSQTMVDTAEKLHKDHIFWKRDIATEPLQSHAGWDLVLSIAVIEYVDDPITHVQQLSRFCKPGGHVIIAFANGEDRTAEKDARFLRRFSWLHKAKHLISPPESESYVVKVRQIAYTEAQIVHWAFDAGLYPIEIELVNVIVIPRPLDKYLHMNSLISRFLMRFKLCPGYVREHSRCVVMKFRKE